MPSSGPNTSWLAVIGKYGSRSALAQPRSTCQMIGIDSSAPTTAMGTTGTPARMAISTKPPRPNRRSW